MRAGQQGAVVCIRDRREAFKADSAEIVGGWVHAQGRWRRWTGANFATATYGDEVSMSWPRSSVVSIRWDHGGDA